ncbi:MAG: hypothetical protein WC678_00610 [Parcubacteria group bacterium]|jgi:hypothetical protein
MRLGELREGRKFRIAGWEKGPVLVVRFAFGSGHELAIHKDGDSTWLKTGVVVDNGVFNVEDVLKTTHVFPATTEVEIID